MSDIINVPKRLKPTNEAEVLAGARDIYDDDLQKRQSEINRHVLSGIYKVVDLTEDTAADEMPEAGMQTDVLYVNDTEEKRIVAVGNERYRTPDGNVIEIAVPAGGYAEINFLNIDGTIFVRGI